MESSKRSSISSDSPDNCPLHLGRLQDAYHLPCGHAACEECLYAIATASRKYRRPDIKCPVCQQVFPFEPERREIEEAHSRAESTGELSRASSVCGERSRTPSTGDGRSRSNSLNGNVKSPRMHRYSVKINDTIDTAASKLGISKDPMVNKRVTITLRLCDREGKVVTPNVNTFVRGTMRFPDETLREIDLLPVQVRDFGANDPTHSFEKVIVPDQVGKYQVDVAISGSVKRNILAYIPVKPSGGKVFELRGSSKFKNPHDIIISGGQYVITDKCNHRVIVTDPEGVKQIEFGATPPKGLKKIAPFGVAGDPEAFYVTDDANKCVLQFVRKTAKLRLWAKVGPAPTGIALDIEHVYVADAAESNIRVFSRHARELYTIGYHGNLQGSLNFPWFLKINSKGQLLVADRNNCRIQVFDPKMKKSELLIPLVLGGKKWHCRGIAIDRYDNVYVTARRTDSWRGWSKETIMVFSPDGDYLGNFGDLCEFDYLRGMAIDDSRSTAIVVDGANHRIKGYRL